MILHIPTREIRSFGERDFPPGKPILPILRGILLLRSRFQGVTEVPRRVAHDGRVDVVEYGHDRLAVGFMALDDLLELGEAPRRLGVGLGDDNDGDLRALDGAR